MLDDAEPVEDDSESEDTDEDDDLGDLPDFTETTKSSADPSSIFSSVGGQTHTTGTSVSNNAFDYAFPVARKRRVDKDIKSQATYTSVMTNDQGERGWLKIPAMPKAVESGKSFRCTVCGEKQKDIINQTEWKKHVFTDLQPYICTFQDCKSGIDSFATRKAWADHEFSVHRTTKTWICNDCAARFPDKASYREHAYSTYREHAYSSHGNVLMRNQLEALVNSAETQVGLSEDNLCPFCSANPGTKSRAFAMHVGRHMEEVALAVLPRDSEFEDDQGSAGSSIDSSSLKDKPDHPPRGVAPFTIDGLEESNLSDYDAQMFCALGLYVMDSAGQALGYSTICRIVGVTPKDPNGNQISTEAIVSYIMTYRPGVYSDVTTRLQDYWKPKAKDTYAEWLKSTTAGSRPPTKEQPDTRPRSPIDWTVGSPVGMADFNFLATIGKGNFSKVMLAERKDSKALFAIKIIRKDLVIENNEVSGVKVERSVFIKATQEKHPFIIQLQGSFQTETRLYFVMEYVSGGDLMLHIQRAKFNRVRVQFYAAEVCLVLKWFHEQGILYRDVKLDNVLLGRDGHIKIADFGLCKEFMPHGARTRTFCGTPEFMAPEIILDKEYGLPIDWWAFGVLVYQMLLQQSPFRGQVEDDIYDAILSEEPFFPKHVLKDDVSLIQQLLVREPEQRLGSGPEDALEVMRHPFFKGINWDDLYHKRIPVPFLPKIQSDTDVSNFDSEFTSVTPLLTPVQSVLTPTMQEEFRGFSLFAPP